MDHGHLGREAGEKVRLLAGGVAAAGHDDVVASVEGPVAHGAVGDAAPGVLELAGDSQLERRAPGGHDHGRRDVDLLETRAGLEHPVLALPHSLHVGAEEELGAELLGVVGILLREVAAQDLRETGDVVEVLGVEQLAARRAALEHAVLSMARPV